MIGKQGSPQKKLSESCSKMPHQRIIHILCGYLSLFKPKDILSFRSGFWSLRVFFWSLRVVFDPLECFFFFFFFFFQGQPTNSMGSELKNHI